MTHGRRIAVVGLGYVGLPIAVAFGKSGTQVIAYEIDQLRIDELRNGHDRTGEITPDDLAAAKLTLTSDPSDLEPVDFYIVTVPTPVNDVKRPDLSILRAASEAIGSTLRKGDVVVYESTVYPGATEDECLPILESRSGLKAPADFAVGYSPERINPGDRVHRLETVIKVVSAQTDAALDVVADVYGSIIQAGLHRAPNIRTAEAAKVIENTQRDLNIALMNELSVIFHRLDIDAADVLAAAGTKWNFLPFTPGLVGGHCIGVDPYYLTHRAEQVGYHPQVILAGRQINDSMGRFVARETMKLVLKNRTSRDRPRVCVLGVTFKPDVPDCRNSKVPDVVKELEAYGAEVIVTDPQADPDTVRREYGLELAAIEGITPVDAVILAVPHREYRKQGWDLVKKLMKNPKGVVSDVHAVLERGETPEGITLWRL
ncbi:MAG: nucleotide sugar dehydrogenase [Rhodospirillales bacterium]|nr:nucleotide sugar dehydrogenase [Rhodospirillales bacterium]